MLPLFCEMKLELIKNEAECPVQEWKWASPKIKAHVLTMQKPQGLGGLEGPFWGETGGKTYKGKHQIKTKVNIKLSVTNKCNNTHIRMQIENNSMWCCCFLDSGFNHPQTNSPSSLTCNSVCDWGGDHQETTGKPTNTGKCKRKKWQNQRKGLEGRHRWIKMRQVVRYDQRNRFKGKHNESYHHLNQTRCNK